MKTKTELGIKGIQKTTLLDYPGRVAAVLFTGGCNFRCPYCQNPSLVDEWRELPDYSIEDVLAFIARRKKWIDGLVITGGEPTLWDGLIALSGKIKSMGLAVKWDTNGSRPDILADGLGRNVVDYIAMDIKASPAKYWEACGGPVDIDAVRASIGILKEKAPDYEFRTTVVPPFHDETSMLEMAEFIGGGRRLTLQQFRSAVTLDHSFAAQCPYPIEALQEFRNMMLRHFDACEIKN